MTVLTQDQKDQFWRDDVLVVEDAIELSLNHLPSTLTHGLIRGEPSGRVRCSAYEMPLSEMPKDTSFFAQQEAGEASPGKAD